MKLFSNLTFPVYFAGFARALNFAMKLQLFLHAPVWLLLRSVQCVASEITILVVLPVGLKLNKNFTVLP